jgi:hypothetical protein
MPALRIMIQGTGSYVGRSVVTTALCRYFQQHLYQLLESDAASAGVWGDSSNQGQTFGGVAGTADDKAAG